MENFEHIVELFVIRNLCNILEKSLFHLDFTWISSLLIGFTLFKPREH